MNPIQTNKPVFFGNDGEVLKSGRIYIGQPNQYPISFPKTVTFQDSSGAQFEAQQPLRTNYQGQVSFNGKAIIALVDGNYSLLIQDRNGATVQDGYTPFVSNPGEAKVNLGSVTQVGLLLSDIKQLDVTPGYTVRNVGKVTATDGLGADWLVVSATGSPADDVDLIDFANGLQGQRINSQTYEKDISAFARTLLDDADAAEARGTLDVYSKAEANGIANGIAIGVGQTWQNVTAYRARGTLYTNSTGKPIYVAVWSSVDDGYARLTVDGIIVSINGNTPGSLGNDRYDVAAIVPNGSTYSYAGSPLNTWAELR